MTRTKMLLAALLGTAVVGGVIVQATMDPSERAKSATVDKNGTAEFACLRVFKRQAHDPDSVKRTESPAVLRQQKDGTARLVMDVRAKNRMGALVLTNVTCSLRDEGTRWDVTGVQAQP